MGNEYKEIGEYKVKEVYNDNGKRSFWLDFKLYKIYNYYNYILKGRTYCYWKEDK